MLHSSFSVFVFFLHVRPLISETSGWSNLSLPILKNKWTFRESLEGYPSRDHRHWFLDHKFIEFVSCVQSEKKNTSILSNLMILKWRGPRVPVSVGNHRDYQVLGHLWNIFFKIEPKLPGGVGWGGVVRICTEHPFPLVKVEMLGVGSSDETEKPRLYVIPAIMQQRHSVSYQP